jgi:hypothetical protein
MRAKGREEEEELVLGLRDEWKYFLIWNLVYPLETRDLVRWDFSLSRNWGSIF